MALSVTSVVVASALVPPSLVAPSASGQHSLAHTQLTLSSSGGPVRDVTTVVGGGGIGQATSVGHCPSSTTVDGTGNIYMADDCFEVVRKVNPSTGAEVIVAGNGNGTGVVGYSGDDGPATTAQLNAPDAVAVDANGNLVIADAANNRVRCRGRRLRHLLRQSP